jgi:Ca-activated chloride channel family protein
MSMKWNLVLMTAAVFGSAGLVFLPAAPPPADLRAAANGVTEGTLMRIDPKRDIAEPCPLKHTAVKAEISGFIARVNVTQEFVNPTNEKIEAVYKFPLPPNSAVDAMVMLVGDRRILGKMKRREEARRIYEAARDAGRMASLLDQERPNIFTQSVANIPPGAAVKIQISYVETLKHEEGAYEFSFPMVVGPRYIPAGLPNAARVVPKRTPEGTRAGHDLSMEVKLDAGSALARLESTTHVVDVARPDAPRAIVKLKDLATIPNKDFILRYSVAAPKIQDSILTHAANGDGFFMMVLEPPARVAASEITPKEIVFVLDTSGSMMGFPIEKAKEAMKLALDGLNPRDTFNLITFAGDTHILFPNPVPATPENVRKAQELLASRQGRGGTEMMKAIRAALDPSDQQDHIRIVCFMTDGEVGNDFEIIDEVKKHPNARVFAFGIGSSTNRFLLDSMARFGRGEVEYVGLSDDGSAAAKRFHERVQTPVLTDIALDFGGLNVTEVYPKRVPDLFSAKPVVVFGRYHGAAKGTIRLRGEVAGRPFERSIAVNLPASESAHDVVPTMWARAKIDDLMGQDLAGLQRGSIRADLRDTVTQLGLDYALMTQFTSFVAVEETTVVEGGKPRRIEVPVEMPEGVSYEGVYGERRLMKTAAMPMASNSHAAMTGVIGGVIGGYPGRPRTMAPPPQVDSSVVLEEAAPLRQRADSSWKISPALKSVNGQVMVHVYVTAIDEAVMQKLRDAGLTVLAKPQSGRIVVGRIEAAKLAELAAVDEVRFIGPQQ